MPAKIGVISAEKPSPETDPARLIAIVNELNRELDEVQKKKAAVYLVYLQQIDKRRA